MNRKHQDYLIVAVFVVVIFGGVYSYFALTSQSTIVIAGSTSTAPVVQALANNYTANHTNVKISVSGGDSGVGINDTKSRKVDIGMSSRNLTSTEAEGLSQYVIGQDAMTIIVNPSNPINNVSNSTVVDIWTNNSTDWSTLTGGAFSGTIIPQSREEGSGTRADFETFTGISNNYSTNLQVDSYNYGILQAVVTEPYAIGYIAHDYANNQVKILSVDGVYPTQQNVQNGSYPYTRNLTLLVKGTPTGTEQDFINFCLSPQGQAVVNNVEYNSTNTTYNPSSGIGPSGG